MKIKKLSAMSESIIRKFIFETLAAINDSDKSELALLITNYNSDYEYTLYYPNAILKLLQVEIKNWKDAGGKEDDDDLYVTATDAILNWDVIAAYIKAVEPQNPCNGALEIIASAGDKGKGYGRLLYNIAMSRSKNGVIGDIVTVSPAAEKVWKNYYASNDVSKKKLDDISDPQTETPDDDCHVFPDRESLNYSYEGGSESGEKYSSIHKKTMSSIATMFKNTVVEEKHISDAILQAAQKFFYKREKQK